MSKLSSISILGALRPSAARATLDFVRENGGFVDYDGYVNGGISFEGDFDVVRVPIGDSDPFDTCLTALSSGRITEFDCGIPIGGETRYFSFGFARPHRLVIGLLSNRPSLDDGTTDFNWHYTNVVMPLNQKAIDMNGIEFSEYI